MDADLNPDLNAGQKKFLNEFTRRLLVEWAELALRNGDLNGQMLSTPMHKHNRYFRHAQSKGWVGKTAPHKVTSKGFASAAAFLKR